MTLEAIYSMIESPRFAAQLTIASNLRTFARAARKQEVVSQLASAAGEADLCRRIQDLTNQHCDSSFQDPRDAAVAVYLWVLWSRDPAVAREAAEEITRTGDNRWWWTKEMATEIVSPSPANLAMLGSVQLPYPVAGPGEQNQGDVQAVS